METIIKLSEVTVDSRFNPRRRPLDRSHVNSLKETPGGWPPVLVGRLDGRLFLADGFHRYAAARELGTTELRVIVQDVGSERELCLLAYNSNAIHGRHLTLADRKGFAEWFLRETPDSSDETVASIAQLSGKSVKAARRRAQRPAKAPSAASTVAPVRKVGELPSIGLGAALSDLVAPLTGHGTRSQRAITRYLERLADALEDGADLGGWETANDAAEAVLACRGYHNAKDLADRLAPWAQQILDVADALGAGEPDYDDVELDPNDE